MNYVLIGIISLVILVILAAVGIYILQRWAQKPNAAFVLQYLKENPTTTAITLVHNGESLVSLHQERPMPLASTVKIIIAIEYAKQAGIGLVKPQETVKMQDLERFYIADLDGNAHSNWVKDVERRNVIKDSQTSLEEVVVGMIRFSSNANTEYLIERLGLKNINQTVKELGLTHHEPLYPFVSSLLIPYELMQKYPTLAIKEAAKRAKEDIKLLSREQYRELAIHIHSKLRQDYNGSYKRAANINEWYDSDFDKCNSERFIAGSTADYSSILRRLNSKKDFDPNIQRHLDYVMEGIMLNPANQSWLKHAGRKGGSTAYVLTEAMYATDKKGHQTELAVFFNQLDPLDRTRLTASLNAFELKLLQDTQFRLQAQQELNSR